MLCACHYRVIEGEGAAVVLRREHKLRNGILDGVRGSTHLGRTVKNMGLRVLSKGMPTGSRRFSLNRGPTKSPIGQMALGGISK